MRNCFFEVMTCGNDVEQTFLITRQREFCLLDGCRCRFVVVGRDGRLRVCCACALGARVCVLCVLCVLSVLSVFALCFVCVCVCVCVCVLCVCVCLICVLCECFVCALRLLSMCVGCVLCVCVRACGDVPRYRHVVVSAQQYSSSGGRTKKLQRNTIVCLVVFSCVRKKTWAVVVCPATQ